MDNEVEPKTAVKPIPVFVINLDRRDDRMKVMEKRLAGIDFIRVSAVDGRTLIPSEKDQQILKRAIVPMSLSELACIKSHHKALQRMIEERWPYACVLEDDVELSPDFINFIKTDHWLPDRFGLIKLETMNHRVWMSRSKQVAGDRDLHELRSNHSGCAGYIFSLDAAKKMTDLLEMPDQAADNLMFVRAVKSGELGEIFQMTPALCIQEFVCFETHSDSDIEPERENLRSNVRKRPVFQRILREVKRPFNRVSEKTRYLSEVHRVVPFE